MNNYSNYLSNTTYGQNKRTQTLKAKPQPKANITMREPDKEVFFRSNQKNEHPVYRDLKTKLFKAISFKGALETAFFTEAKSPNPDEEKMLDLLMDLDFNLRERDPETQKLPLHYAVEKGLRKIVAAILDKFNLTNTSLGQNPDKERYEFFNARDMSGKTSLHYDKGENDKILLSNGADMLIIDDNNNIAAEYNDKIIPSFNKINGTNETLTSLIKIAQAKQQPQTKQIQQPSQTEPSKSDDLSDLKLPEGTVIPESETSFSLFDVNPEEEVKADTESKKNIKTGIPANLDDVAGLDKVKAELKRTIIEPLAAEMNNDFENNELGMANGILLYGPSGNGKTFIVEALANQLGLPLVTIDDPKSLGEALQESEEKFKEKGERTIIFIDEIDAVLKKRQEYGGADAVSSMMKLLDNSHKKGVILIAATNKKDSIDDAAIRAGRFDKHIYVSPPDAEARKTIIATVLKDRKLAKDISEEDMVKLAKIMSGFSASATKYIAEETLRTALLEGKEKVNVDDFKAEIAKYSKEQNITEINEENTTSLYDTEFKREKITYPRGFNDVAGMKEVKEELQKSVVKPLKPEVMENFEKNGITILNGLLFYGPPGNGKTYIAEALANEVKLPMYKIDMSSIGSSFKNETSIKLGKIFAQLEKKFEETGERSILFMDEIEAIMEKRSDAGSSKKEEIDTILQLMNNASKKGILVIGATNLKDSLDEAVLRPGRLDKHIFIPPPDTEARKSIIELVLKNKPIAKNITEEDISGLASIINGFSASSIRYLSEETLRNAILDDKETVSVDDFKAAIAKYSREQNIPEANDENATSIYDTSIKRATIGPDDPRKMEDVGGMEDVKKELYDSIIYPWKPEIRAKFKANGIKAPNGVILYGPPGCGKTFIMKAVAGETKLPLYVMDLSDVSSSYIHETSKQIRQVFNQLRNKYEKTGEASILFLDEFDSIASEREGLGSNSDYKREEINTLLGQLNNASDSGVIVVGATNDIGKIDKAVKRTGRFDRHIYLGYPDFESRKDVIRKVLKNKDIAKVIKESDEAVSKIAELTDGLSNSDIAHILNTTARKGVFSGKNNLELDDFVENINEFKKEKEKETNQGRARMISPFLDQKEA